jgi:hypothetical protein
MERNGLVPMTEAGRHKPRENLDGDKDTTPPEDLQCGALGSTCCCTPKAISSAVHMRPGPRVSDGPLSLSSNYLARHRCRRKEKPVLAMAEAEDVHGCVHNTHNRNRG